MTFNWDERPAPRKQGLALLYAVGMCLLAGVTVAWFFA
jgi:hypothetical protein